MTKPWRVLLPLLVCTAVAVLLFTISPSTKLVPAPPGPADLGPATGLSTPTAGAIVFDLKYLAQTGRPEDIQYRSFWGYGGLSEEQKTNSFIQDIRKQAGKLHYVYSYPFNGRKWSAVEYRGRRATTLFFDLNGNGRLDENERIQPSRKTREGFEFITPDFVNPLDGGGETLCRALLQVNFYKGSSEPNSMWSPAALMEGTTSVEGQPVRLLLYANSPGGRFDKFGSSSYSLLSGDRVKSPGDDYIPRQTLSSVITSEGLPAAAVGENTFYRLLLEGRRSNGLPARVVLVKDPTPTGSLAVKLASSNSIQSTIASLSLFGLDDQTVVFRINKSKGKTVLPAGAYSLESGSASYGTTNTRDWDVWFSGGGRAAISAGEVCEVTFGQPVLKVRAIEERERYSSNPTERTTYKQGTPIYLQPSIVGKGREKFTRFQMRNVAQGERADRPPKVSITGPDGKQVFSATMEYG